jgi:hypothetical protein
VRVTSVCEGDSLLAQWILGRAAVTRGALRNSNSEMAMSPASCALVLRDGKPVYQRAVGWAGKEASRTG